MQHQALRSARLQEMEAQRQRLAAQAARNKQRQRTAAERATVEHLALRAADNMTQSVNEALATYCAFEELPMYTPPVSTLDGWRTLGFTIPGMSEHKQPSLGHNKDGIIATRSLWEQPRQYRNTAGEAQAWKHPFLVSEAEGRGANQNTKQNTGGAATDGTAPLGKLAGLRGARGRGEGGPNASEGGQGGVVSGPELRPGSSSSRRNKHSAGSGRNKSAHSHGGVLSSTYEGEVKGKQMCAVAFGSFA